LRLQRLKTRTMRCRTIGRMKTGTAALLIALFPGLVAAQAAAPPVPNGPRPSAPQQQTTPAGQPPPAQSDTQREPTASQKRRAGKAYLAASKLFVNGQFEAALSGYKRAAELDATNPDYRLAIEVARGHAVTAMIQSAAKARLIGDEGSARADLTHALELDPKNVEATQHLFELGDDALLGQVKPPYQDTAGRLDGPVQLLPSVGVYSFHTRNDQIQILRQVFAAYGITAMFDDSVRTLPIRLDLDDARFAEAARVLGLVSNTFYVPLDPHRVLVARDTRANRLQYTRQVLETVYVPGLSEADLTEVNNLVKNVFDAQQASADPAAGTITLRASPGTINAFNTTVRSLLDGRNQVLLDIRMIQVAHSVTRNTGVTPMQSVNAFNVYAEEQSILNANQSLVQQIISSGLASPGDTLAILGILLASGQVSSSLFSNGVALFGGGLTASALSPGPTTLNLALNTSDSRELDQIQLRLGDGEAGTIKEGERYPIQTASYSSLSSNASKIAGLTSPGSSSGLSSLVSSLASSVPNIPMVQYQDLGLTLKATPKVMRSSTVALTIDMKIDSLSGQSINGNPVLNSQAYSGVATLKEGEASVIAAELSKTQSRSISGTPGISEIPGLNDITDKDLQSNYATLIIVITPHVVRGTQSAGHTPMMMVQKTQAR